MTRYPVHDDGCIANGDISHNAAPIRSKERVYFLVALVAIVPMNAWNPLTRRAKLMCFYSVTIGKPVPIVEGIGVFYSTVSISVDTFFINFRNVFNILIVRKNTLQRTVGKPIGQMPIFFHNRSRIHWINLADRPNPQFVLNVQNSSGSGAFINNKYFYRYSRGADEFDFYIVNGQVGSKAFFTRKQSDLCMSLRSGRSYCGDFNGSLSFYVASNALPRRSSVRFHCDPVPPSRLSKRALSLPERNQKGGQPCTAKDRSKQSDPETGFRPSGGTFRRDGGPPLSAKIGAVVIGGIIAGISIFIGIGAVVRLGISEIPGDGARIAILCGGIGLLLLLGCWIA